MLRAKAEVPGEPPATPEPPRPAEAEYPGYWFEPSERLESLYDRRERLADRYERARYNPSLDTDRMMDEVRDLEREIEIREAGEKEEWQQQRDTYDRYQRESSRYYRWHRNEERRERNRQEKIGFRARVIKRIGGRIEQAFKPGGGAATSKLRWRPLPPGKRDLGTVTGHYKGLQRGNEALRYDEDRIRKAFSLRRNEDDEIHEGTEGFDGYLIFTFDYTPKVLMECAWVGNGIYIISHDWEHWSKKSKQELKADDSGLVTFIPHQGNWFERVKQELGAPPDVGNAQPESEAS